MSSSAPLRPIVPDTPLSEIPEIHASLKRAFKSGKLRDVSYRRHVLAQLAYMLQENELAFAEALARDFRKHRVEVNAGEIAVVFQRCLNAIDHLEDWLKEVDLSGQTHPMYAGLRPGLIRQSRGPVLIIGPFNAPFLLTLQPLIGAIAAGCPAVVKPSDLSIHSSCLLAQLIPKYLDSDCFKVVLGGVDQSTLLLDLKWSSIVYTGGMNVGRIVAAAAAKHLTPVTLELGGKCPVIIDPKYDMELAAKRVLWGKMINAGQVCISPDYVLIPRDQQDNFVNALVKTYNEFFPNGSLDSPDTGGIINERHFHRVQDMLKRSKGKVVIGGKSDTARLKMEVTVVRDVQGGDSLMEDEVFGPILSLVPVDNLDDAIDFLAERPEPLAIYAFSLDEDTKRHLRDSTLSGTLIYNDTFMQLNVAEIPVSALGASGYGYQGGKYAFDTFIHNRGTMDVPAEAEPLLSIRYPPYTDATLEALSAPLKQNIPLPRASTSA
ncbi:hypothetical protein M422DRAFT_179475 [Sphaerobolus stellatus SS14]|uniref:Aldehyde dehydrogenase n=1 Tax=Sphaerobolus stellatus (strain SS14) TaxID=990650 RepID=A0A0C9VFG3_SPHS4|nr:hypothetical protein M422DRAFT_179475 [Sphaerobolus stellatus SS14]